MVRDEKGQKMSKTKGNVIDPLVITEGYGADALRFTLAALTAQGRDIKLAKDRIEGYRAFANKLWNATRFALMNLEGHVHTERETEGLARTAADRWILARTRRAVNETVAALEGYRFNEAAGTVYHFVWHELCDWYIELAKEAFYGEDAGKKRAAQATLTEALSTALRLLHPFMPFITEELWHVLRERVHAEHWPDSILAARYPATGEVDEAAERAFGPVIGIVDAIRNIRGEMNIPFKVILSDIEIGSLNGDSAATLREELGRVHRLANATNAIVLPPGRTPAKRAASAVAVGDGFELRVGLAGAVDLAAESTRIEKEIAKLDGEVAGLEKKLANESFVRKAPPEVVEKDRARLSELREKKRKLDAHRAMLSAPETELSSKGNTMQNQNEPKPQDASTAAAVQDAAGQVQTAVAGAVEKVVTTATDIAKAAGAAVVQGIEQMRKQGGKKPARKAAPKSAAKKPAAKAKAKAAGRKTSARRAPAKKAAARGGRKTAAKRGATAARKTAAKRGGRKTAAKRGAKR
jgi:valyl-tRNA synthetase